MEMLAVKWGCMSDEEKVPYYQKAAEVKDAHRTKVRYVRHTKFWSGLSVQATSSWQNREY